MLFEVFFDVETKKLFSDVGSENPADLGVSIVSVYSRIVDWEGNELEGAMKSFWERELGNMWELFEKADRIIGFNTLKFDIPALAPYAPSHFGTLPHFDLFAKVAEVVGRKLSLYTLARDTLGHTKTDNGLHAVQYFANGDAESLGKLRKYCEADVLITRDLYDFGIHEKHLKYMDKWNRKTTIPIDFSYPKEFTQKQIGLF